MLAPTVNVTAAIHDQAGQPIAGAIVTVRLDRTDVDPAYGYVVPRRMQFVADAAGGVVMRLWPNRRGAGTSRYHVLACHPGTGKRVLEVYATVPETDCQLRDIAELPA